MLADIPGGWEIVLILTVVLVLYGARTLPDIRRGLGKGFFEFRKSLGNLPAELDQNAHDAGESLGGIYGKPAAQALTPVNQVAELYNPAAFGKWRRKNRAWLKRWHQFWKRIWRSVVKRWNSEA
jgi:sec-independent protein translocase protein TatA